MGLVTEEELQLEGLTVQRGHLLNSGPCVPHTLNCDGPSGLVVTPGCFSLLVTPVRPTQPPPRVQPHGGHAALAWLHQDFTRRGWADELQTQERVGCGLQAAARVGASDLPGSAVHSIQLICGVSQAPWCCHLSRCLVFALRAAWSSA